ITSGVKMRACWASIAFCVARAPACTSPASPDSLQGILRVLFVFDSFAFERLLDDAQVKESFHLCPLDLPSVGNLLLDDAVGGFTAFHSGLKFLSKRLRKGLEYSHPHGAFHFHREPTKLWRNRILIGDHDAVLRVFMSSSPHSYALHCLHIVAPT